MSTPIPDRPRRVLVLGSTGSIGTQTLDVLGHLNTLAAGPGSRAPRFEVVGLVAGKNESLLNEQCRTWRVPAERAVLAARDGHGAAERLVRETACDIVVAAMVGAAGLPATLAAVELGRDVALANKETLVAAGSLIVPMARQTGARLLPVDSEHSALWQCLQGREEGIEGAREQGIKGTRDRGIEGTRDQGSKGATAQGSEGRLIGPSTHNVPPMVCGSEVAKIVLTASGGPFRTWTRDAAYRATPAQALKHPTWSMGAKVTIDSASLTNKAFEVIEAHWLFGLEASRIGVLIHPQSIVHSLVEYADGSVIAQLGPPDMRSPIQYALTYPQRPEGRSRKLDWAALSRLDFEPVDGERFPALGLAYRVIEHGGVSGSVFNGASEEAVNAFLSPGNETGERVPFGRLSELAAEAMDALGHSAGPRSLADVLDADAAARRWVRERLAAARPTISTAQHHHAKPVGVAPVSAASRFGAAPGGAGGA